MHFTHHLRNLKMKFKKIKIDLRGVVHLINLRHLHGEKKSFLGKIAQVVSSHCKKESCVEVGAEDDTNRHNSTLKSDLKKLSCEIEDVILDPSCKTVVLELCHNPLLFHYILDFYVTGRLHLPSAFCARQIKEELVFWGLSDNLLEMCCWARYREEQERHLTLDRVQREWGIRGLCGNTSASLDGSKQSLLLRNSVSKVKQFLEDARSSRGAQIYSWLLLLAVLVSVTGLTLETLPSLREFRAFHQDNASINTSKLEHLFKHSRPVLWLRLVDTVVVLIIMIDFMARLCVSSSKALFMKSIFNVIDLLVIIPSCIVFVCNMVATDHGYSDTLVNIIYILNIIRVFRVLRIFRIMHQYKSLKILFWAWKTSYRELVLLLVILCLFCSIYGSLVFYVEIVHDNFMHIPQGLWWAVITMTTVGYGDIHPVSTGGYFIGAACAITGLVVVAMPVPIIVQNFGRYYYAVQTCERLKKQNSQYNSTENNTVKYSVDTPTCRASKKASVVCNNGDIKTQQNEVTTSYTKSDCCDQVTQNPTD